MARVRAATARSSIRAAVLGAVATLGLSGCAAESLVGVPDVPESPEVAAAPWPSLLDAPEPVSQTGPVTVATETAKGPEIQADLAADAARLRALEAEMAARPVISGSLAAEARALRAKARALDALP